MAANWEQGSRFMSIPICKMSQNKTEKKSFLQIYTEELLITARMNFEQRNKILC